MNRTLAVLAASLCLAAQLAQSRADVPPAEKLLPDDTLVVISVPDVTKGKQTFERSPQGRLWHDPAIKAFKDNFISKLREQYITPIEQQLGIHLDDYTSLLQGQLTFAVTRNGWTAQTTSGATPALLLMMDSRDRSAQLKTALADFRKKWVDAGKKVRTERIRDVDFNIIDVSTNDLPAVLRKPAASPTPDSSTPPADSATPGDQSPDQKTSAKNDIYIGQSGSLLLLGSSPKALEGVLARLSGSDVSTLADLPAYQGDSPLFRDATWFAWINAKAFLDVFSQSQGAGQDSGPDAPALSPSKIIAALGLNGLKSIALSYQSSDDGALGTLSLGAPESGRAGIFKILAGVPKDCLPPAFVPPDAVKFQRWRIDGRKGWETLTNMLNDGYPPASGFLGYALTTAEAAAKEKDPDFDINKNLFGNLGDDMLGYSRAPKADALDDPTGMPSIFLLGSPNAEQLAAGLRSLLPLLSQSSGTPTDREFLGQKIYTIPLPATPGSAGSGAQGTLSYTCSGGYIAFATDGSMIEDYLRNSQNAGKSLRDTPGLTDAAQKVAGANASVFGYSDDSLTMKIALARLKKVFGSDDGSAVSPLAMALGGNASKFKEWFDLSLLPDFSQIAKYFSFTVYGETATPNALVFRGYTPTPPQLKQTGG
jgi:hypothetical protein